MYPLGDQPIVAAGEISHAWVDWAGTDFYVAYPERLAALAASSDIALAMVSPIPRPLATGLVGAASKTSKPEVKDADCTEAWTGPNIPGPYCVGTSF